MKGLFMPEITAEMFRNGCLESIEALMADGEIYDIDYEPERKTGEWIVLYDEDSQQDGIWKCSACNYIRLADDITPINYCPNCGAKMWGKEDDERRSNQLDN